jgi:hypothetical protein
MKTSFWSMGSLRQKGFGFKADHQNTNSKKSMEGKEGDPNPGDNILDHQPRG